MTRKRNKESKFDKIQMHLMNLEEMVNMKLYNLLIELSDFRLEIRQLRMDLRGIEDEDKKN